MKTIWLFICRFFAIAFLELHGLRIKSAVYTLVREPRDVRNVEIKTFLHFGEISDFMARGRLWVADGWKSLWDAVHSARFAQRVFDGTYTVLSDFDCDDHARFATTAINASIRKGVWRGGFVQRAHMFAVMWVDGWRPGGHMVTLGEHFRKDLLPFGEIRYYWADYDNWNGPFRSLSEVAASVRSAYAPASEAIGHCKQTEDLVPLETHWGE